MFKRLQWRMTLMYTLILISVLFVTDLSIYTLMLGYNNYQMGTEIRNMLENINSSEWLYESEISQDDKQIPRVRTVALSFDRSNNMNENDIDGSFIEMNTTTKTIHTVTNQTVAVQDVNNVNNTDDYNDIDDIDDIDNDNNVIDDNDIDNDNDDDTDNDTDTDSDTDSDTDAIPTIDPPSQSVSPAINPQSSDNEDSEDSEDDNDDHEDENMSPSPAVPTPTENPPEDYFELPLPEAKDLVIPKAIATFPVYMVFDDSGDLVQQKFENSQIFDQLLGQSNSVVESDVPQVITVTGDSNTYYLLAKMPITIENQRLGSYVVARDVTVAYKTIDNLVIILIISLITGVFLSLGIGYLLAGRSLKPIKQAYDSKQEFLANASHELKTPLSVIMLSTETLDGEIDPALSFQRQVVAGIKDETLKMSELVSHLLFLSRQDNANMIKNWEYFDFSELLENELKRFSQIAAHKNMMLKSSITPDIRMIGDQKLLSSVITILVDNAIKYTPEGGQVFVELMLSNQRNKPIINMNVKDTGIGIPESELENIFERFYRLESSRSKETGGSGLGLAIAREIVEEHGGTIKVNSIEKIGTTFSVLFPIPKSGDSKKHKQFQH